MEVETATKQTAQEELEECRSAMEEISAKLLFLKKEARQRPKAELRELITQMSLLFIGLRQVNRAIFVEEDRVRAETESAKAPVGFATLQLHNLMYEKNHYLKAIKACKDFKWKHPDIELVPEEQFFSDAPDEIKGKLQSTDSAHDLMLKRLNFELLQRKELCKHREKLEQHRSQLMEIIADRKKFLSSLPSHLKSLKKATLPVQQQLGILHTKKLKQHHAAELLPVPLYIVYTQLLAQKEAFQEKIEMEVLGSLKEAQAFAHQQTKDGIPTNVEHNRLEEDVPDEEDYQRRRKRSKKRPVKDELDQAEIFQSHPLKIILHIYDDETLQSKSLKLITLRFEYLLKLNVICVGIEGIESDDGLLCNLFPDDTGIDLPHEMAKNLVGESVVFSERNSLPYKWAQILAGIDILPQLPSSMSSDTLSDTSKGADISSGLSVYRHQNRVQTILQRLRSRKKSQMALVEQLDCLMKLKWPLLSYEKVPWAAPSHLCTFTHCSQQRSTTDTRPSRPIEQDYSDPERRSVTPWELETAREDGELLPAALPVSAVTEDSRTTTTKAFPVLEHTSKLSSISKSTPPSRKVKRQLSYKDKDDMDLLFDSESDVEECVIDLERDNTSLVAEKLWQDHGSREYILILTRKHEDESLAKLEAKVKITSEYPLRPPLFRLSMSTERSKVYTDWHNMICAMEEEVNLHIFKLLPLEWENYILAHQVQCLAMLFDLYFDICEKRGGTSGTNVGFNQLTNGNGPELSRSYRGRERRIMLPHNGSESSDGALIYPW